MIIKVTMAIMVILVIIVTMVIGILTHQANLNELKKILSEKGAERGLKGRSEICRNFVHFGR